MEIVKTKETNPNDIHLMISLESNETNAPDGKYYIATNCIDYQTDDEFNDKLDNLPANSSLEDFEKNICYRWFMSDTQVEVSNGLFNLGHLIQGTKELLFKQKYWGRFLESVQFVESTDKVKGHFKVGIGS